MILLCAAAIATGVGFSILIATNSKLGVAASLTMIVIGVFGLYTYFTT